ncbi:MAG: DUF3516 domain-containing protein, partial [Bdellovibrio sp.]
EKGFLIWNKETFQKLVDGKPEGLVSRFQINHAMLLNILNRPEGRGCRAIKRMIHQCHETSQTKRSLRKRAFQMFRSLVERNIVEFNPLRVNVDLQEDFSLNHALSLYLIDTIQRLDSKSETYALDILTLAESILENPDLILRKQLDRLKQEKVIELKQMGMEYEERMEELEKLEHPKPNRDFIYSTFNEFVDKHPWIEKENIRPKSVAREMYTAFYSFSEYIREYDLQRAEGLLLRYLTDVYKVLLQNIPLSYHNEALNEIIIYIGGAIRQIDSSLLDEWESMRNGGQNKSDKSISKADETQSKDINQISPKALRVMIRNEVFRFVKAIAQENLNDAVDLLALPLPAAKAELEEEFLEQSLQEKLKASLKEYQNQGYGAIVVDVSARGTEYFILQEQGAKWTVQQTLLDNEGPTPWHLCFEVDVQKSMEQRRPALSFISMELGSS